MAELGKDELKIHCDLLNKLEVMRYLLLEKFFMNVLKLQKR